MIISHKIALDPNAAQENYFACACGAARFAYNWELVEWKRQDLAGEKPSEGSLRCELNSIKDEQLPWLRNVTKNARHQGTKNLGAAFKNFFAGTGKYPKCKKKGQHDRFRADDGADKDHPHAVEVNGRRLKLPVIGWVKMRGPLRFHRKLKSAACIPPIREIQAVVGVDLGIKAKALATLCDDTPPIDDPKALGQKLKKLKRLSLSRKVKGSANRLKAKAKIARLHARIANIRVDALHKLATDLVRRFGVIGIEDSNVRGMLANRHLARAVADVRMSEFGRQLAYKSARYGARIVVADRRSPSSKRCSACGHVHADLTLSDREWSCDACGVIHDRDRNAAINLRLVAESSLAAASLSEQSGGSVQACGEQGSDVGRRETGLGEVGIVRHLSMLRRTDARHSRRNGRTAGGLARLGDRRCGRAHRFRAFCGRGKSAGDCGSAEHVLQDHERADDESHARRCFSAPARPRRNAIIGRQSRVAPRGLSAGRL
jgi:putative transposase